MTIIIEVLSQKEAKVLYFEGFVARIKVLT